MSECKHGMDHITNFCKDWNCGYTYKEKPVSDERKKGVEWAIEYLAKEYEGHKGLISYYIASEMVRAEAKEKGIL